MDYSFDNFQKNSIIMSLSLNNYYYIINNIDKCNTTEFQKKFNAFYKIRRGESWRKKYYNFFYKNKDRKNITFEEILKYLYEETGNIEASFASKMLSTINPNMPIWDQYVLKNLLNIKEVKGKNRLDKTICVYNQIVEEVNNKLKEKEVKNTIKEIRKIIGKEYKDISDTKILDYILWSIRNEEKEERVYE